MLFAEHHLSHAASAFFPSPFEEAVVLTMDGVGEWTTTSVALGRGNRLEVLRELHFPHSLGLLYSAFTYYTGFKVNSGEYKLMGLAPYGEPKYAQAILENLIDLKPDGSFRLNLDYFDYCTGLRMTNRKFDALFGGPPRDPSAPIEQRHMDLAASIQAVLEEAVLRMTRALAAETGVRDLCLAGGVALNCVANGKVLREGRFRANLDSAGGGRRRRRARRGPGRLSPLPRAAARNLSRRRLHARRLPRPGFPQNEIEDRLRRAGARFEVLDDRRLLDASVDALVREQDAGLVSGADGIRPARAGRPLDSGGRPLRPHAVGAQPQDQAPRVLPALRSFRPCAKTRASGSSWISTAHTCCWRPASPRPGCAS